MTFCTAVQQAFADAKNSDGLPYPDHSGGSFYATDAVEVMKVEKVKARLEHTRRTLANNLKVDGHLVPAELSNDPQALKDYAIAILHIANRILDVEGHNAILQRRAKA